MIYTVGYSCFSNRAGSGIFITVMRVIYLIFDIKRIVLSLARILRIAFYEDVIYTLAVGGNYFVIFNAVNRLFRHTVAGA